MPKKKLNDVEANDLKVKYMQLVTLALSELLRNTDGLSTYVNSRAKTIAGDLDHLRFRELPLLFGHKDGG